MWDERAVTKRWVKLARDVFEWFYRFEGGTVPKMDPELALEPEGTYHPPNFDLEGGYCEGLMYVDAVLADSFFFTEPYRRKFGEEILPLDLMHKISQFILYNSVRLQDRMRVVNFDDTRSNWATSPVVTAFLANKLLDERLQWYLHWTEENFNEPSPVPFHEYPAFTFIWYDPNLEPRDPGGAAPVKVFPGIGWASIRSGWGTDDVMLG
ncbi:MAG TPA: hypothetical protein EYP53_06280 [Candidatus Latescibacteria bacterium]|nr:hypothetical protein [Candidatus Latescibacterota bacterium]